DSDIATIIRTFGSFAAVDAYALDKQAAKKSSRGRQSASAKIEAAKTFASKIFATHEFGFRRLTIERPLRLSYQFSAERLAELRFAPGNLNAPMKWLYKEYAEASGKAWRDDDDCNYYGNVAMHEEAI